MNKKEANNLWPLMKAYSEGAIIEFREKPELSWIEASYPDFLKHNEYRIKSQPKLVPFTFEDNKLLQGKYICRNGFTAMYKIIGIDQNGVSLIHSGKFKDINYNDLFILYCFSDGSNCGKYINE